MNAPVILQSPQLAFLVACACGQYRHDGIRDYQTAIQERDRLREATGDGCACKGSAWTVDWYSRWAVDPIATVRAKYHHAFALPPCPANGRPHWSLYPHAEWHPEPMATGDTEAAAWAAAVAVVTS